MKNKKLKIIIFALFFFIITIKGGSVSAASCNCTLVNQSSTCSEIDADDSICVNKSFVDNVINAGLTFDLRDGSGNDLDKVKLTASSFAIKGTKKIYFSPDEGLRITRPSLTDINLFAYDLIEYKSVTIYKYSGVSFIPSNITFRTNEGLVIGGDIFNQPSQELSAVVYQGNGGNVILKGKIVSVGNISCAGISGDGGNISIYGKDIKAGSLSSQSIYGWVFAPVFGFSTAGFGRAGQITILPAPFDMFINSLYANNLFAQGLEPSNIVIKANERIWITDNIYTYSACEESTKEEKCDYGNLCQLNPVTYKFRRFCKDYKSSGKIILQANGTGQQRGVRVGSGINNSAYSGYQNSNLYATGYSGAGIVGKISLYAPNGIVFIGSSGINSTGFHTAADPNNVNIKGTWVQVKGSITSDNFDVTAFTGELINPPGQSAGNIWIEASNTNLSLEPTLLIENPIYARARYAFAPNGGDVNLVSNYRIEGTAPNGWGRSLIADTSGFTPSDPSPYGSLWYLKEGVSLDPATGSFISDTDAFCREQTHEYYNGTDGQDGVSGGNGGNISVTSPRIQWASGTNILDLKSNGGNGSRGGIGAGGNYCSVGGIYYQGPVTHTMYERGSGGQGGTGGIGGSITVSASRIHCFKSLVLKSNGGKGGESGDYNVMATPFDIYNNHTGNCDLTGWRDKAVKEIKVAEVSGAGGAGGNITLKPMPTDDPIENITAEIKGGDGGDTGDGDYSSYPWYCTNPKSGAELINIAKSGGPNLQTPCQTRVLSPEEVASGISRTSGVVEIAQTGFSSYGGQSGASGGDGGSILIDSPLDISILKNFYASGGIGRRGGTGQSSSINQPGNGGIGGKGGNAGTIQLTNINIIQGQLNPGAGGAGGLQGASVLDLPRADSFCAYSGTYPYWDYGVECPVDSPYCCSYSGLNSCRTKDPLLGGSNYSAENFSIKFIPPSNNGSAGEIGSSVQISSIPSASKGPESCAGEGGGIVSFQDWGSHNICYAEYCIAVMDQGPDECSDSTICRTDDKHRACGVNICNLVSGEGSDECFSNSDCGETHLDCSANRCVSVSGGGEDKCLDDSGCDGSHYECVGTTCVPQPGEGKNECLSNNDCDKQHLECDSSNSCVSVSGEGSNQCFSYEDCEGKSKICTFSNGMIACLLSAKSQLPDECSSDEDCCCGDGIRDAGEECGEPGLNLCFPYQQCINCRCEGEPSNNPPNAPSNISFNPSATDCCDAVPSVAFSWTYSDPDEGDLQSAYQVQVATDEGFNNLIIDTNKVQSSSNSYATQSINFSTNYYWRVMVWDTNGPIDSPWASSTIPSIAEYPCPSFTWDPSNPNVGENTDFFSAGTTCPSGPCNYLWTFESGTPASSTSPNPANIKFNSEGSKEVVLMVTDSLSRDCSLAIDVPIGMTLLPPEWIEIPPF
ncbi:MAG: hypothetical protein PHI53_02460 [Candidatus Pacebacteria bacterium]|nr:hypothetical protein [Candidatus Paceibacterota bacterium]